MARGTFHLLCENPIIDESNLFTLWVLEKRFGKILARKIISNEKPIIAAGIFSFFGASFWIEILHWKTIHSRNTFELKSTTLNVPFFYVPPVDKMFIFSYQETNRLIFKQQIRTGTFIWDNFGKIHIIYNPEGVQIETPCKFTLCY